MQMWSKVKMTTKALSVLKKMLLWSTQMFLTSHHSYFIPQLCIANIPSFSAKYTPVSFCWFLFGFVAEKVVQVFIFET